ncbi:type II toxin-antitoxin system RelE family toxin [Kitasatospora indigofera]|uniref:type II toxin-antitoxin system RelE family toxin n=1 Tax=Kitasatospora indigofera TaxID=67307 RepID=UPI0036A1D438
MPKHAAAGRRAAVSFTPEAEQQARALEPKEAERLDRALAVIAADPIGAAPPMVTAPVLREYRDANGARVIYYATVLGSVVVVAYLEA